jgi:hypothetical protein
MSKYYTYLIGWKNLNKWYYGVKYSKDSDPEKFWKEYFTSSSHVNNMRQKNGEPDVVQIRKIFDDPQKARMWEHRVLKRMKVVINENWLNKTDNICFDPKLMSEIGKTKRGKDNNFYGRNHTDDYKLKMSIKQKSLMTEEKRKKISEAIKRKHANGEYKHIYNDETSKKISESNKGQIPWNKGGTLTEEHKKKISESEKETKSLLKGKNKS